MEVWPNLFIVGAPKAGTSSLHAYLQAIPGIYMSKIKEPNYFSRVVIPDDHPIRPIRDRRDYLRLFAGARDARIIGEASPTYLADPEAPQLIYEASPKGKVLISLRDPVERAYSHYLMMRNNGTARLSFLGEIKRGIENSNDRSRMLLRPDVGLYNEQTARFLETFGKDRVQVIIFEEFTAEVRATLRQVLEFLGLNQSVQQVNISAYRPFGEARGPLVRYLLGNVTVARLAEILVSPRLRKLVREKLLVKSVAKPLMDQDARGFLKDYYREDVRKLTELLGRPLPWRNFAEGDKTNG